jgi:hypothetical protein
VFILDSLLVGGLRFVLDKVATVVDHELNDETALRERLVETELRVELGEITKAEASELEADILSRLRQIRERQAEGTPSAVDEGYTVTGVEASFEGDEH